MREAYMNDGRKVIVDDTSNDPCRDVGGTPFFLAPGYVHAFLDGSWQTVRSDNLRRSKGGSPFDVLRKRK